ncbi:MAG TPA: hypothetical protein VGO93_22500 [Candidatus Xenobia bacterium]|jgi:hypothetical protein
MRRIKRWVDEVGRSLEYMLTGQKTFRVTTGELKAGFETITDRFKARQYQDDVKDVLWRRFAIKVEEPVIFELFAPDQAPSAGEDCPAHGVVGFYRPHLLGDRRTHLVFVVNNLPTPRFRAVYAHELVHAWERESGILPEERVLREGLARWVEYKLLLEAGRRDDAHKVLNVSRWAWGKGIRIVLDVEKQVGEAQVIETLRQQSLARRG